MKTNHGPKGKDSIVSSPDQSDVKNNRFGGSGIADADGGNGNHTSTTEELGSSIPLSVDTKKKRKAKKLPVAVELDELVKIFDVARLKHHKLAYILAWYSGCRISEVLNIEPRDVDLERGTILIRQGKNSKDRVVPMPMHFRKEHFWLMPLRNMIKARALQKAFIKDCGAAGLLEKKPTLHFHSLRHGFVTHGVTQGIDITRMQILAGHASVATTSIYTHLKPQKALEEYGRMF